MPVYRLIVNIVGPLLHLAMYLFGDEVGIENDKIFQGDSHSDLPWTANLQREISEFKKLEVSFVYGLLLHHLAWNLQQAWCARKPKTIVAECEGVNRERSGVRGTMA
jgi:hypothetical protein